MSSAPILWVAALCLLFPVWGCADSPEAGLEELLGAARSGNAEALYPRLTDRSIALVEASVLVGGSKGPLAFGRSDLPTEMVSLRNQRGTSIMVIKEGDRSHVLPWIEEKGRWKVDLFLMTGFLEGDRIPNFPQNTPP